MGFLLPPCSVSQEGRILCQRCLWGEGPQNDVGLEGAVRPAVCAPGRAAELEPNAGLGSPLCCPSLSVPPQGCPLTWGAGRGVWMRSTFGEQQRGSVLQHKGTGTQKQRGCSALPGPWPCTGPQIPKSPNSRLGCSAAGPAGATRGAWCHFWELLRSSLGHPTRLLLAGLVLGAVFGRWARRRAPLPVPSEEGKSTALGKWQHIRTVY